MRLSVMADSFRTRLASNDHRDLSHEEFISLLIEDEYNARHNRKLSRMIGRANFKPEQACIENIDYSSLRGFQKKDIMRFTTPTWIGNAQNLIITGPTGSGKTYLAEAIGFSAIKMGFEVMKIRYRLLFEEINNAKGTGLYLKLLKKLSFAKVLIIDDFLMQPIQPEDLGHLMEVVEEKEQTGSIIITTQFPVDKWHLKMPDPTIADAICDRLIHGAIKFDLKGGSMRKNKKNPK
ncbi:MAG: IS21-like element helper ATPase IstB [Candidatus Auribacterota bacterium]|nr:IS21-like element helper ATPase IstB [Candidatus Auribacterota bacterium]